MSALSFSGRFRVRRPMPGSGRSSRMVSSLIAHPLTAPAVRPATNWRCRKKNTATTGSEIITEEAISSP